MFSLDEISTINIWFTKAFLGISYCIVGNYALESSIFTEN